MRADHKRRECHNLYIFQHAALFSFCSGIADLYEIPFEGMVQHDPSFEEMREVVVVQKRRPYIPNRWHANEVTVASL